MVKLEVIQGAVTTLLERLEDIVHKGHDKQQVFASVAINEVRDTVRLIDMAFSPLHKEMQVEVKNLKNNSNDLFNMIVGSE